MKKHSSRAEAFIDGYTTGVRHVEREFIDWLKNNRHIINGIDVLDVDKKIKEIAKRLFEDG